MNGRPVIIRRLDAALAKMGAGDMEVRAIYLTEADWDAYNRAQAEAMGVKSCACFQYGGHEIRGGKQSMIYSKQGVGVTVPKEPPQ